MCDFRVGDRVIIHKPDDNWKNNAIWTSNMNKYDGVEATVTYVLEGFKVCQVERSFNYFDFNWLEKVEGKEKFDSDVALEDFL